FNVELNQIVLGNGSNDVLELISHAFLQAGDSAVYSEYAFAVYPLATQAMGATGICVKAVDYGHDLDAMRAAILPSTKIVWIANPNNPTGTLARPGDLIEFMELCPSNVIVVLDEAYTEFLPAAKRSDSIAWLKQFPNLIVVRTFSKAYGLAGLRVGFALASSDIIDMLNRVRQAFNVNSLAQAAACAALDDLEFLQESVRVNNEGMQQITDAFRRLGIGFIASSGNFVTFHCGDAKMLNQFMLERGVIVRPLAGYGMANSLRVSIGLPAENARFIAVLEEAMAD
ncbi:MAG: histidinol-phosphate transaminase, partial [Deefgea sp.]